MPFLLMLFLTFVCWPELDRWPGVNDWPVSLLGLTPAMSAAWTALVVALPVIYLALRAQWVRVRLRSDPVARDRVLARFDHARFQHQFLLFAAFLVALCLLGWRSAVQHYWSSTQGILPGAELALLAPYLLGLVLSWCATYDADRAAFDSAHRLLAENELARALAEPERRGQTMPAFGSRFAYVLFQVRQKLALVFIPIGLLLVQKELQRCFPDLWKEGDALVNLIGIAVILAIFAIMPWIIRLVLGLRPIPAGGLRTRLEAMARRLRFRCSDVLLWNTNNGMANAMVVGVLPWPRYVVFTDKLLDEFTAPEVEAVFGHEVGHIRHHHMLCYMLFLMGSMLALGALAGDVLPKLENAVAAPATANESGWSELLHSHGYLEFIPLLGFLAAYILVVFGFLSRRCERQADLFGCRAVSCGETACGDVHNQTRPTGLPRQLCPAGIRTFIGALEKVAIVNGIHRERPGFLQSWQHSTIARRVEFLQRVLVEPALERRFQRRVAIVKWGLFAALGLVLVAIAHLHGWAILSG